ncbi:MAG: hypothetical protein V4537_11710 [Pseudomonadota bacterium]
MATYFFNIVNDDVTEDPEGAELADDHAARAHAIIAARSLAADTVRLGHLGLDHRIEITNAAREVIDVVTFADAVEIRSAPD